MVADSTAPRRARKHTAFRLKKLPLFESTTSFPATFCTFRARPSQDSQADWTRRALWARNHYDVDGRVSRNGALQYGLARTKGARYTAGATVGNWKERISSVISTRSPTFTPPVSSKTCISAVRSRMRSTSARRRSSPTHTYPTSFFSPPRGHRTLLISGSREPARPSHHRNSLR